MVSKLVVRDLDLYLQKTYFKKIPQLGRVIIEENVEIGSNSTVIEDQSVIQ